MNIEYSQGIVRIIGFDSAWTDNKRARGAICALIVGNDGAITFVPPRQASFDEALAFIETQKNAGGACLIAIDQPTIVPNKIGCRPVDRIAASLISFIGGGVQPANRSKTGIFDDDAPIWRFKKRLRATENPEMSRTATSGLFIIEVYPYLALPALNPAFSGRLNGPKYNPTNKKFRKNDWCAVIKTVERYARIAGIEGVEIWARQLAENTPPKKAEQDQLDSVLCALVGYHWRAKPRTHSVMIGDLVDGYMIAPTHSVTGGRLAVAAKKHSVPIDGIA
jgi:predicted RNase H-like nuclease